MNNNLMLVLLCICWAPLSVQGADQPFEITVTTAPVIASGAELDVQIIVRNKSEQELPLSSTNSACDYIVSIVDENDKPVASLESDYARYMNDKGRCRSEGIRNASITLKPGESAWPEHITLNELFHVEHPGVYKIQVLRLPPLMISMPKHSRAAPNTDWLAVKSNQVEVTVTNP